MTWYNQAECPAFRMHLGQHQPGVQDGQPEGRSSWPVLPDQPLPRRSAAKPPSVWTRHHGTSSGSTPADKALAVTRCSPRPRIWRPEQCQLRHPRRRWCPAHADVHVERQWSSPTGPQYDVDGSASADVVYHEYTHGPSNRLVGNGAGLTAFQSQAMGEGWSTSTLWICWA